MAELVGPALLAERHVLEGSDCGDVRIEGWLAGKAGRDQVEGGSRTVDLEWQGHGLGAALLEHFIVKCLEVSQIRFDMREASSVVFRETMVCLLRARPPDEKGMLVLSPRRANAAAICVVAGLMAVLSAGCGSGAGGEDEAEAAAVVDPAAERLAGRYAHYDVVAYESTDMKTHIVSFGFTDLDIVDGELQATESFCHADHRSDQPIEVEMPDAATRAIIPESTPVTLTTVDGRAHISRPATPTGIGVDLADPANDPLPTDPEDPRIADDDNDGNPGVTTRIRVTEDLQGELYIARREIFAYDVVEQDDGSLTGTVTDNSEQLIIGATNDAFLTSQAPWVQHPDLSKSPIILIPVERDWDCERLMAERDDLLPPTPEVDW